MLCENLVKTRNEQLDMSVTVRVANLDLPRSEERLKEELLAHAVDCHECLTVVLFQQDSLAECGCPTYREMFQEAMDELVRGQAVDPAAHLTEELLKSFFLDRLSESQMAAMAEHVEVCSQCRTHLQERQAFYLCIKAAAEDQKESRIDQAGLTGVLGVTIPDKKLSFCARFGE